MLSFNARSGLVLVGHLGHASARLAIADFDGVVLSEREAPFDLAGGPDATVLWLREHWRALLDEAGYTLGEISVIAIGLPGLVEPNTGWVVELPGLPGWEGFPFADAVAAQHRIPVLVDSDVNLIAIGEHRCRWRDTSDFIFVKLDTAIASALLLGGRWVRGAGGTAGEIAHVQGLGDDRIACACGGHGCLAAVASGQALVGRLNALGIATACESDIAAHIAVGASEATLLVRDAGRAVGAVLSALITAANPEVVVLGGSVADIGGPVQAAVREEIYRRSRVAATADLRVTFSSEWKSAAMIGASRLAVDRLLGPSDVDPPFAGFPGWPVTGW